VLVPRRSGDLDLGIVKPAADWIGRNEAPVLYKQPAYERRPK
jgi:hypothetical protein